MAPKNNSSALAAAKADLVAAKAAETQAAEAIEAADAAETATSAAFAVDEAAADAAVAVAQAANTASSAALVVYKAAKAVNHSTDIDIDLDADEAALNAAARAALDALNADKAALATASRASADAKKTGSALLAAKAVFIAALDAYIAARETSRIAAAAYEAAFAALAVELLGELSDLRIERDGDRDINTRGWTLAESDGRDGCDPRHPSIRWTEVSIFLTTGDNVIVQVTRKTEVGGERSSSSALACQRSSDALAFLVARDGGELRPASKAAWEAACRAWPPLGTEECEVIA